MKAKKLMAALLAGAMSISGVTGLVHAEKVTQTVVSENYDGESYGGIKMVAGSGTATLDTSVKKDGTGSLKLTGNVTMHHTLNLSGCVEISYDAYWESFNTPDSTQAKDLVASALTGYANENQTGNQWSYEWRMNNGTLSNNATTDTMTLETKKWYNITMRFDTATSTQTLYVDGVKLASADYSAHVTYNPDKIIRVFQIVNDRAASGSVMYMDNYAVKLYDNFTPAYTDVYTLTFDDLTELGDKTLGSKFYKNDSTHPGTMSLSSDVKKGTSGNSAKIEGQIGVYSNPAQTGNVEISYDCYWDSFSTSSTDLVLGFRTNKQWSWELRMTNGTLSYSGGNQTKTLSAKKWYTFTFRFDTANDIQTIYVNGDKFVSMSYADHDDSSNLINYVQIFPNRQGGTEAVVYIDNFSVKNYTSFNESGTCTLTASGVTGDITAEKLSYNITAEITDGYASAGKIKFMTSSDGTNYEDYAVAEIDGGKADVYVPAYEKTYVKAVIYDDSGMEIGETNAVTVKAADSTVMKIVAFNFTQLTTLYAQGKRLSDYNYFYQRNREAYGVYNPVPSGSTTAEFSLATNDESCVSAGNAEDGIHDEYVIVTSNSTTMGQLDPITFRVGYATEAAYTAAVEAGTVTNTYAVMQYDVRFPDFNSLKELGIWMNEGDDRRFALYPQVRTGGELVLANQNLADKAEVLKTLKTDVWYSFTYVYDIHQGTGYLYVDGEYLGSAQDAWFGTRNIFNVWRGTIRPNMPEEGTSAIHFDNFCVSSLTFADSIEDAVYTSGDDGIVTSVKVKNDGAAESMTVVTAVYGSDKALKDVKLTEAEIAKGTLETTISVPAVTAESGDTVKTFCLDSLEGIKPLRESKTMQ